MGRGVCTFERVPFRNIGKKMSALVMKNMNIHVHGVPKITMGHLNHNFQFLAGVQKVSRCPKGDNKHYADKDGGHTMCQCFARTLHLKVLIND